MIVHGATFDSARLSCDWGGRLKAIIASKGFTGRRSIPAKEIASVTVVTSENRKSLLGTAEGAIWGTLLAGPVGLVVGSLASGNHSNHVVGVVLASGEGFVAEVDTTELNALLGAASHAANAQRESVDLLQAEQRFREIAGEEPGDLEISSRPVLKRLRAEARIETPDKVSAYESMIRQAIDNGEVESLKQSRKELRLSSKQKACAHARVLAYFLLRVTAVDELSAESALKLRQVQESLRSLGWAPGD